MSESRKKFSIRLKVVSIILWKVMEAKNDRKLPYVKFIGGDETGEMICFASYRNRF